MQTPPPMPAAPPRTEPKSPSQPIPLGEPMEHLGLGLLVETLLKRPENLFEEFKGKRVGGASAKLAVIGLACYVLYGLLVGSFSGGMQWWASPLKIAGGVLFSSLICLPSLYIFGCLARSETSLKQCVGLLAGMVALSGVLLIGFITVSWVFSTSIHSLAFMGFLHLVFWWIAFMFGTRILLRGMTAFHSESSQPIHIWMLIFLLVLLQMTVTLRPLLGPGEQLFSEGKQFVLPYWGEQLSSGPYR
ncbi:MAG: hypothetical protein PF795_07135 [Kiritimatiellae bacterium]|jgi:hypothetical protein|nr:hypothetical protein [Kiritimatiellia bacterium]